MREISKSTRKFRKIKPDILLVCAVSFIPVFLYYMAIFNASVNIPFRDDYDAILGFANSFLSNTQNRLALLFSFHNEHRILFCRGMTVLTYFINGKLDFRILTMIGNLTLLAFVIVLSSATVISGKKMRPLYFVPVFFILFQPQYWESSLLSMGALSTLPVLLFSFLTLNYLDSGSMKSFIFSMGAAIFTTFINGNGMLIFLSGLIILIFYKRYKKSLVWVFAGVVTVYVYFIGYSIPSYHPSPMRIFNHPVEAIEYFFCFIGSALPKLPQGFRYPHIISFVGGVFLFLYFIFLSIHIKSRKITVIKFAFLGYLFLTALLVTFCRFGFGIDQAFSSRYVIYSDLFIVFAYLTFVELSSAKVIRLIFPFFLMAAVCFNCFSYKFKYPVMISIKKALIQGLADWRVDNNSGLDYPDHSRANAIMQEAIKNGLYDPPKTYSIGSS